jgi:hypothetical protein
MWGAGRKKRFKAVYKVCRVMSVTSGIRVHPHRLPRPVVHVAPPQPRLRGLVPPPHRHRRRPGGRFELRKPAANAAAAAAAACGGESGAREARFGRDDIAQFGPVHHPAAGKEEIPRALPTDLVKE